MPKYHVGTNGPAVCKAVKIACRFETHGTQAEMLEAWESSLATTHENALVGVSKPRNALLTTFEVGLKAEMLNEFREAQLDSKIGSSEEQAVALRLAEEADHRLSYAPVAFKDPNWRVESATSVARCELTTGGAGYFKSYIEDDDHAGAFDGYGMSALSAGIAEVNAYRLAKLFGEGYDELVPETAFRAVDGEVGTLQKEVKPDREILSDYEENEALREDFRNAAIFDFVIGNMDRHSENYIYEPEGEGRARRNRIRLIDNSFSFPAHSGQDVVNESVFADNYGSGGGYDLKNKRSIPSYSLHIDDMRLKVKDLRKLAAVREGVARWIEEGTIAPERGAATLERIDLLLKKKRIQSLSDFLETKFVKR